MRPQLPGLLAALLVAMILVSRSREPAEPTPPPAAPPPIEAATTPFVVAPVTRPPRMAPLPGALAPTAGSATPAIDRLAALAVRRRIAREGDRVYLDSAWAETDSTVVRWADRGTRALTVVFHPDTTLPGWDPAFLAAARAGMAAWGANAAGLRFEEVTGDEAADIEVGFVPDVSSEAEFGVTQLNWEGGGRVAHAEILLALRPDSTHQLVPAAVMRRVAIHEFGHALGLPHSSQRGDVMFPTSPVTAPSGRDQATLRLLYAVPAGPLRVQ